MERMHLLSRALILENKNAASMFMTPSPEKWPHCAEVFRRYIRTIKVRVPDRIKAKIRGKQSLSEGNHSWLEVYSICLGNRRKLYLVMTGLTPSSVFKDYSQWGSRSLTTPRNACSADIGLIGSVFQGIKFRALCMTGMCSASWFLPPPPATTFPTFLDVLDYIQQCSESTPSSVLRSYSQK